MGLTKPRAAQIFNLDYKQSTRVVTTTNITLTGGAPNSVDGVNLSLNDRILVTGQTTGSQNGLYLVTTLGSGSNGTWARTSDGNENGEIEAGMIVMVTEGTIYADTQWKLITDDPIVINTTALTFTQNYSANSISAGTSNVVVNSNANVTVSSAGTANVLTVSNTGAFVSGVASASGNITGGNLITAGTVYVTSNVSATGNIRGGNINTTGLVTATGNITGGNLLTAGLITATGNITGNYIFGNGSQLTGIAGGGGTPGGANTQIQFNDASSFGGSAAFTFDKATNAVATTGTFSATGNISGGNITTPGLITATGNIQAGNIRTAGLISATGAITGAAITGTSLTVSTGNITAGNLIISGAIVDSAQLDIQTSAANANIVLTPNGTGVIVVAKDIRNGQATGVGNIGAAGATFNTIFAKATSAQYADLAEKYTADADYAPGTVVMFGGTEEVTVTTKSHSTQVAGIVSTNPSYLMNAAQTGKYVVAVALVGRVPCQVTGTIAKGDRLVASDHPGVAQPLDLSQYEPACIIGKALESYDSNQIGTIEVAVGRT